MVDPPSPGTAPGPSPREPDPGDLPAALDPSEGAGPSEPSPETGSFDAWDDRDPPDDLDAPIAATPPGDAPAGPVTVGRSRDPGGDATGAVPPVPLFGDPPADPVAEAAISDYEGIGSASRSCLVILLLATAIVLLICLSTAIRAVT
ncbi:MAG: hypothetical protein WKF80_06340 [Thermomicrobiales bacterium]